MKHIVILVPPDTSILDVTGPLEVLSKTNDILLSGKRYAPFYQVHLISMDASSLDSSSTNEPVMVATSSGMPVICEGGIAAIDYPVDTIIIAGRGSFRAGAPQNVLDWIVHMAKKRPAPRIASVCAGAFILAQTGLLNGRRATTHWMLCEQLTAEFPKIKVEKDPIFIKDGIFYTSAGVSTGIDLTLGLVEEDLGKDTAIAVARMLVLYLKRPGSQSQFSTILEAQLTDHLPVQEVTQFIGEHLDEDLSVERLADIMAMSARNFSRIFTRETGVSPAKYVEKVRVETARRRLEESNLSLDQIAEACGLINAGGLRRLFIRHLKISPGLYRKNFGVKL